MDKTKALKEIEVLKESIAKLEKQIDSPSFPQIGDSCWAISLSSEVFPCTFRDCNNPMGVYKTEADAELMLKWVKMQKVSWLPEDDVEYWYASHSGNAFTSSDLTSLEIATGNCFKTEAEAVEYADTMKAVAQLRKEYL